MDGGKLDEGSPVGKVGLHLGGNLERQARLADAAGAGKRNQPNIRVAQECQQRLQAPDGLKSVLADVGRALPGRLHDTAYAVAFEVATVDLEMRMEEVRVLELIREALAVDEATIEAVERATKARHRTLT